MTVSAPMELRRNDYSLSDEQQALQGSFRIFFEKRCGSDRVRAAEPTGFDEAFWDDFQELRPIAMGLTESAGGDGAGLVELALVAEELGRCAAPVPFIEVMVAARALARTGADDLLARVRDDGAIVTVALSGGARRLVPAGSIAEAVLAKEGSHVVLVEAGGRRPEHVPNLASAPLAWWELASGIQIAPAQAFDQIELEWRLLTAAALVGLGQTALDLGVQYAKDRNAFGVPIGSFQAIAHPLADAASAVAGARQLVWKAAWFAEHEPHTVGALGISAFLNAAAAAEQAGAVALHTQGGFGFTLESDVQLHYRRAKGWALVGGDRRSLLREVADITLGPVQLDGDR